MTRTVRASVALSLGFLSTSVGCGSSSSTPGAMPDASSDAPFNSDAGQDAGQDNCSTRGTAFMCQAQASCWADYMPVPAYSCGVAGLYCCIRGTPSPGGGFDAGSDTGPEAGADTCTPQGASYACQNQATCLPDYMPASAYSCGSPGLYCCVKGAIPDSGAD